MNDIQADEVPLEPMSAHTERMRRWRMPLMIGGVLLIVLLATYYYIARGRYESTDDAYVNAARISISSNVAGRVVALEVHDNQRVEAGQILFRLDERPLRLVVQQAQAKLATARLQVESLKATRLQKLSELRSAEETFAYQQREAHRQQRLVNSDISSQAQLDRAVHAQDAAAQNVAAVRQEIASITASLGGDPAIDPALHPSVQEAQAALDRAALDLSYAVIRAPEAGIVAQVENLQVGDYVNAATPVFALLVLHRPWVDAHFKEVQLTHMQVGQPATVKIDTYRHKAFHGHVASLSPATGAQFSVLPAQNATGNWVKVVQRLTVRIEIDDTDAPLPLYAGLSATVTVDTRAAPATRRTRQTSHHAASAALAVDQIHPH